MKTINDPNECAKDGTAHALTIGVYDGVHVGHQAVIAATRATADRLSLKLAVVTFDPHPAYLLRPESAPLLLTGLKQKLELLAASNVDTTVVVPFDSSQSSEPPPDFVKRVLVDCLQARAVVVGQDFHFGAGRAGNVETLKELGSRHGFGVEGVGLLARSDGKAEAVSSTAIRRALAGGEVATAAGLLGRNHEVRGLVVSGDQRGRTIGFPTANVEVNDRLALPADAVYAGWYVRPDGSRHPAAINIGRRPTFHHDAKKAVLEAHLISFSDSLYGEEGRIEFVKLLRSEQRFDGVEGLVKQLNLDVAAALEVLGLSG